MKLDSNLEIKTAQLVSLLTEPILILVVGTFLVISNSDLTNFIAALVFLVVGGLFPIAADVYEYFKYKRSGLEPSYQHRNEIYLTAFFSFSLVSLIFGTEFLQSAFWMDLAMVVAIFFALYYIANRYFVKASLHIGMFCLIDLLLVQQLGVIYALAFALLPIIIWARIRLNKHTWAQIIVGMVLGMAVGLLTWLI